MEPMEPIEEKPKQRKAGGMRWAARPIVIEEEPEPVVEEVIEIESSSSSEEIEYVKESVEGICDFDFC